MTFADRFYSKVNPYKIKEEYDNLVKDINKQGVYRSLSEDDKLYTVIYAKEEKGVLQKFVSQLFTDESPQGEVKGISAEFMMGDVFLSLETKTLPDENNEPQKTYSGFAIDKNGKVQNLNSDETNIYFSCFYNITRKINIEEYNAGQNALQE